MAATDTTSANQTPSTATPAAVPKRIVNAQTVCNEKNEKGKLCNGHLKQLRTAGEAAEIHLRGDDVLSKCQTCGTFYMGPPLGHVRDPHKQSRFVEAELTALLQAAGGTLPVIKKDERGVFVMVETAPADHGQAAKPAAPAKPTASSAAAKPAAAPKPAAKPSTGHSGANPNRQLFKRSTYSGYKDTGPVAGETFEQKVARLRELAAGAKRRSEEGGGAEEVVEQVAAPVAAEPAPAPTTEAPAKEHKATGNADRTLMKRATYCGVVDTGPVEGETFQQKVERLAKVSAAAKQRAEGG